MRSLIGFAASVLVAASAVIAQTTLPNAPGGFGVVSNSTIAGNGSAVGTSGESDGKYSVFPLSLEVQCYNMLRRPQACPCLNRILTLTSHLC